MSLFPMQFCMFSELINHLVSRCTTHFKKNCSFGVYKRQMFGISFILHPLLKTPSLRPIRAENME